MDPFVLYSAFLSQYFLYFVSILLCRIHCQCTVIHYIFPQGGYASLTSSTVRSSGRKMRRNRFCYSTNIALHYFWCLAFHYIIIDMPRSTMQHLVFHYSEKYWPRYLRRNIRQITTFSSLYNIGKSQIVSKIQFLRKIQSS